MFRSIMQQAAQLVFSYLQMLGPFVQILHEPIVSLQEAQLSQRGLAMPHVVEYFR